MISEPPCKDPNTLADRAWPYEEYYIGERDEDNRKTGYGTYHWSGAESLERYTGDLLRDTLHGYGEYTYRHRGPEDLALAYEGHYFNNYKFGYGLTSYTNGRVYRGLYHSNFRWGPGVETDLNICESVGLWRGRQLMRLTWKPSAPSVAPDLLSTSVGNTIVAKHRTVLVTSTKIIGEINSALDLLKEYGAKPLAAAQNWPELYPKNCTDPNSQLYHRDLFQRAYYHGKMVTLEKFVPKQEEPKEESEASNTVVYPEKFYAWNNNEMIIHMMKHCYLHDEQRQDYRLSLEGLLNGPRTTFKPPAQHELDCRTMLLACYLGHIRNIAQLINEYDVHPDVSDMQGNSALMYATCGNQREVIQFLVEAGARINDYNDACCTPLGVALLIYACAQRDIPPAKMLQSILPPPGVPMPLGTDEIIVEWKMKHDSSAGDSTVVPKTPSNRTIKSNPAKRLSINGKKSVASGSKHDDIEKKKEANTATESVTFSDDKRLYHNLVQEYNAAVTEFMSQSSTLAVIPYLFEVTDMTREVDMAEAEELKKLSDKKETSKIAKMSRMQMASTMQQDPEDPEEQKRQYQIKNIYSTIERLLLVGADPRRVNCPQSALSIAVAAQCTDLIQLMIKYGADVKNEQPQALGYSLLDVAISGPMTMKNVDIIHTLLENGANADHRVPFSGSEVLEADGQKALGPTLLHVVLAKRNKDPEGNDEVREAILALLLDHGSDPTALYNGRAAMDIAMSEPQNIFDLFIENPNTDLNAIINSLNQTILVKMFYMPYSRTIPVAQRLPMLTNLLQYGADPLLKCQNVEEKYDNLFVFTKKILSELSKAKPTSPNAGNLKKNKSDTKAKKAEKKVEKKVEKKPEKGKAVVPNSVKSVGKVVNVTDDPNDYKQAVTEVTNGARLLFIRWLQGKLMKELIEIVDKYKHRHWNMILKEYKNGKSCGLWLNPVRCLEIWDILATTKKRTYSDSRVLKYVLYIVQYHLNKRMKILQEKRLSSQAKTLIEMEVSKSIQEHSLSTPPAVTRRPYVAPELFNDSEVGNKFNICFECALPLEDAKIPCGLCKLVDFCSFECMGTNIERLDCHPCSDYLKKKYFPTPEPSQTEIADAAAQNTPIPEPA